MNIKRQLKKAVNKIEPNNEILTRIKTQCGIPSVRVKEKKPFYSTMLFKTLTPVMACLALAITCVSVVFSMPKQTDDTSYVLLNLGSLVELKTQDDKVIEHTALNQPAQVLLLDCNYQNETIEFTILDMVNNAKELGIIQSGDHINISTFVKEKDKQLMKSDLYQQMNNVYKKIGSQYVIDNTYKTKKEFLNDIANKYACSTAEIKQKNVDELIKIYTNYNSESAHEYEHQIKHELNDLWQENMTNLENDFTYKMYKAICEKLDIVSKNLQLLKENPNDQMFAGVNYLITQLNLAFGTNIESVEISDDFINYINNYLTETKQKMQNIIDDYILHFENMELTYKQQLINNLNRNQAVFLF